MDNLRRFPAPWVMEEHEDGFRVKDANGFFTAESRTVMTCTAANISTLAISSRG